MDESPSAATARRVVENKDFEAAGWLGWCVAERPPDEVMGRCEWDGCGRTGCHGPEPLPSHDQGDGRHWSAGRQASNAPTQMIRRWLQFSENPPSAEGPNWSLTLLGDRDEVGGVAPAKSEQVADVRRSPLLGRRHGRPRRAMHRVSRVAFCRRTDRSEQLPQRATPHRASRSPCA
jgi:hypothetical protein